MLQNAYFLAKIGADTAENEQHFAEILPIGRRVGCAGPHAPAAGSAAWPGASRIEHRASLGFAAQGWLTLTVSLGFPPRTKT